MQTLIISLLVAGGAVAVGYCYREKLLAYCSPTAPPTTTQPFGECDPDDRREDGGRGEQEEDGGEQRTQTPRDAQTSPTQQGAASVGDLLNAAERLVGGVEALLGLAPPENDAADDVPPGNDATETAGEPLRRSPRSAQTPRFASSEWNTTQRTKIIWSKEDETALQTFVEDYGTNWRANRNELELRLPGRAPHSCEARWSLLKPRPPPPPPKPSPPPRPKPRPKPRPREKTGDVLSTTIEGARSDLDRLRDEFGDEPSAAEEDVLAAQERFTTRAEAALERYSSLLAKRDTLSRLEQARRRSRPRISRAAADVKAARTAYNTSYMALDRERRGLEAELDEYDLVVAKEEAGDNPGRHARKTIAALEKKAQESRAKTNAGVLRVQRAKKHAAEVLAAAVIEDTPPEELLAKVAKTGDAVAAYALGKIRHGGRHGTVVYIGNSTERGCEAEIQAVLRRDNFLVKEKGGSPVALSRLTIKTFPCGRSAVEANLVEHYSQIKVGNKCGAEDILYSCAGAGGIHCKNVKTVTYVFSFPLRADDEHTPSPFQCGKDDLTDLRQAVIAAAVSRTPMPTKKARGDVEFYLRKVDGDGVYRVLTRKSWCVRRWKRTPWSPFEFETTRLWPSPAVARAEAESVFAKKTDANYSRGRYEKVGEADYTDAMDTTDNADAMDTTDGWESYHMDTSA